jgi:pyruvate formate lyase activating enzyme
VKHPQNTSAQKLFDLVSIDDIYFQATGGGITFGGGEPLLYPDGIQAFANIVNKKWVINVETSLNVPWNNVAQILPYVDTFIVDIKDMNEDIYFAYTGQTGTCVRENLNQLSKLSPNKIVVRIPSIPGFNTDEDINRSKIAIENMGIRKIDVFTYRKCVAAWGKQQP